MTRGVAGKRVKAYAMELAVLLTVVVGLSRVYVGVHYATDVLAGSSVGSAWAGSWRFACSGAARSSSPKTSKGRRNQPRLEGSCLAMPSRGGLASSMTAGRCGNHAAPSTS
jgi:membrane-associated phospholipid phosphatase